MACELYRERPDAARRTIDQHALAAGNASLAQALQRGQPGRRHARRLLERHPRRLPSDALHWHRHVLSQRSAGRAEYVVTRPELRHVPAHCLDGSSELTAHDVRARPAHTPGHQSREVGLAHREEPVDGVQRHGPHAHEDGAVGQGRSVNLLDRG